MRILLLALAFLALLAGAGDADLVKMPFGAAGPAAPSIDPNAAAVGVTGTSDGGTATCTVTNTNPSTLYVFIYTNASAGILQALVTGPSGVTWTHRPVGSAPTGTFSTTDMMDEWASSVVAPGTYGISASNIGIAANSVDIVCFAVNNSTGWDGNAALPRPIATGTGTPMTVSGIATSGSPVMIFVWGIWGSASASCAGQVAAGTGFSLIYGNAPPGSGECMGVAYKVGTVSSASISNPLLTGNLWRAMADAIN